ncbi:hypothetical protein L1049_008705 [Liquidambar formosana]|uniref:Uncharacterized protein n=1 Tax=Liquidambar formosana TaxID=63359 RepID=A0AAP0S406_LIQFO
MEMRNQEVNGDGKLSAFEAEKSAGVYNIDVKLYLRIRFRLRKIKTGRFKPKIKCDLKVPLSSNGVSAGTSFEPTKCKIDF